MKRQLWLLASALAATLILYHFVPLLFLSHSR